LKRILIISDLHCGHRGGLTPPSWQYNKDDDENVRGKFGFLQATVWDWFVKKVKEIGPVDLLVCNGDAIDGKGGKNGGVELLTGDRREQCEIAAEAIRQVEYKKLLLIRGTPYHVGDEENWEDVLAGMVNATDIGWHEWVDADGVILDFKHKISRAETAKDRETIANLLWAERGVQPIANILIRSHVHIFVYRGDSRRIVISTPCFQGWSGYGVSQTSGTIDIGMLLIECDRGEYTWKPMLLDLRFMAARPLTV